MELHNFDELMAMTSSLGKKCTMAVAGAGVPSAIDAVLDAYDHGIADSIPVDTDYEQASDIPLSVVSLEAV